MGFVERPLVIGLAWWAVTGDMAPALQLAVFFELFWLDLYPIGGFVPPMPAFPFLSLLFLCRHFGWESFSIIAFPLVLCLPFAYVVPLLEIWQRNNQKNDSIRMVDAVERGNAGVTPLSGRVLTKAVILYMGLGLFFFVSSCLFMTALASLSLAQEYSGLFLPMGWPALYLVGAIGAVVGLRVRRVYLTVLLAALASAAGKFFL